MPSTRITVPLLSSILVGNSGTSTPLGRFKYLGVPALSICLPTKQTILSFESLSGNTTLSS